MGTTSNGTTWHDSEGAQYDCEYYSEGDNCETYGDGYQYDGYTANQACCTCAATQTPTSAPTEEPTNKPTAAPTEQPTDTPTVSPTDEPTVEPTAECDDSTTSNGTTWHDSVDDRYTCDWYSQWVNCETYGDKYEYDGYTANQACCTCAGSNSTNAPTNSAPSEAEQTKHPTYAPTEQQQSKHPTYAPTEAEMSSGSEGYDSELLSVGMSSGSGACEDYTTSNGTTWHDSEGAQYDCEYYSEGDNCETYGDGYQYDGYTANQACCTCAATQTPTSAPTEEPTNKPTAAPTEQPTEHPTVAATDEPTAEPTAECDDSTTSNGTAWHDSVDDQYTCDWYSLGVNCESYGDKYEYDGYTANQACCACAGSNSTNAPTNSAPTEAEQTKHP